MSLSAMTGEASAMTALSAHGAAFGERAVIAVQYDGRPSGQAGTPGGPDWHSGPGWRGEWHGGSDWHREWPSNWGGGWYGGWYQPYWGNEAWSSPYWVHGHPDYYGGSPGLCSGGNCAQAPYTPLK